MAMILQIMNWRCLLRGARRREAGLREDPAPIGVLPALRPTEPRDPTIGVDQARAETRERIHRYNTREVKR
jgi:hypothetical protein